MNEALKELKETRDRAAQKAKYWRAEEKLAREKAEPWEQKALDCGAAIKLLEQHVTTGGEE